MGFLKEVVPAPIRYIAFQYDGTQQSLDDLAVELGTGATALNLTRIDASTWQYTFVGTAQRDTDWVVVWKVLPNDEVQVATDYPDDTEYATWWPDA